MLFLQLSSQGIGINKVKHALFLSLNFVWINCAFRIAVFDTKDTSRHSCMSRFVPFYSLGSGHLIFIGGTEELAKKSSLPIFCRKNVYFWPVITKMNSKKKFASHECRKKVFSWVIFYPTHSINIKWPLPYQIQETDTAQQ